MGGLLHHDLWHQQWEAISSGASVLRHWERGTQRAESAGKKALLSCSFVFVFLCRWPRMLGNHKRNSEDPREDQNLTTTLCLEARSRAQQPAELRSTDCEQKSRCPDEAPKKDVSCVPTAPRATHKTAKKSSPPVAPGSSASWTIRSKLANEHKVVKHAKLPSSTLSSHVALSNETATFNLNHPTFGTSASSALPHKGASCKSHVWKNHVAHNRQFVRKSRSYRLSQRPFQHGVHAGARCVCARPQVVLRLCAPVDGLHASNPSLLPASFAKPTASPYVNCDDSVYN